MNKQAFTFLTLLTLVLLLGAYYVTLPADTISIEPDQLITSVQDNVIEQYNELKQQQNEEMKMQNEQVISSSSTTSDEKLEALRQNSLLEGTVLFEENVMSLLKESGYEGDLVYESGQPMKHLPDDNIMRMELLKYYEKLGRYLLGLA